MENEKNKAEAIAEILLRFDIRVEALNSTNKGISLSISIQKLLEFLNNQGLKYLKVSLTELDSILQEYFDEKGQVFYGIEGKKFWAYNLVLSKGYKGFVALEPYLMD